jgi:phosphoribosylglycinamide formyltransferase 1
MNKAIIIFASGEGSNAIAIHQHALASKQYIVACIVSNKKEAGVLQYAALHHIPTIIINKKTFNDITFLESLACYNADLLVLAGFLWLVPSYLIAAYPIVNIHPALLPKYGGAGMYGHYVHEAVVAAKETESGITIHLVNEHYDKGKVLLQKKINVLPKDTANDVAQKVLVLEHQWYKIVIENLLTNKL